GFIAFLFSGRLRMHQVMPFSFSTLTVLYSFHNVAATIRYLLGEFALSLCSRCRACQANLAARAKSASARRKMRIADRAAPWTPRDRRPPRVKFEFPGRSFYAVILPAKCSGRCRHGAKPVERRMLRLAPSRRMTWIT